MFEGYICMEQDLSVEPRRSELLYRLLLGDQPFLEPVENDVHAFISDRTDD